MRKHSILIFAATLVIFTNPVFAVPQPPSFGIVVQTTIDMHHSTLGTYNNPSGSKVTVMTNSIAAGAIDIGSVTSPADAIVGVGGDPYQVISNPSLFSSVSAAPEPFIFPLPIAPPGLTNIGAINGTTTIGAPGMRAGYQSSSINLPSPHDTITINGNVTLYVTGDISLVGHFSGITINPGASLALYAGGNIDGGSQLFFNTLIPDAKRLQIYGLPTCTSINWHNDVDFWGTIYAPNANITMDNNCNFYGAVTANSFLQSSGGSFNYDASLVPEPATLLLLGLGAVMLRKKN